MLIEAECKLFAKKLYQQRKNMFLFYPTKMLLLELKLSFFLEILERQFEL